MSRVQLWGTSGGRRGGGEFTELCVCVCARVRPCLSVPPSSPNRDRDADLEYVRGYVPEHEHVHQLRFLLYGAVGAGKSSFINSVSNVMRGRMTIPAAANAAHSEKSFTKKVRRWRCDGQQEQEVSPE